MHRFRVLVVDDEDLIRWSLRWHLERAGYGILEAPNGERARELFREPVDLVLLDLRLPDADGLDLLRELKHVSPDCPVIIMTAHADETQLEGGLDGVYSVVDKPFDFEGMAGLVEQALSASRQHA